MSKIINSDHRTRKLFSNILETNYTMITLLFYLSGLINILGIGILAHGDIRQYIIGSLSSGYSVSVVYDSPARYYPQVFGAEGCIGVILWGLAYIAVARKYKTLPLLCLVFCLEKIFYTVTWVNWYWSRYEEIGTFERGSPLLGLFFRLYGYNDAFFAVVFFIAFIYALFCARKESKKMKRS